ncbi:MAG: hypothetical protein E2P02_29380 [Acidobacteria bacterium]|nr:MAG: hypothetical protein E2P02_29380 [Acidobacteriota bacterium]
MASNRACSIATGALLLAAACSDSSSPSAPTSAPPPPASTANLAVFSDPGSTFQTTDVFDSNGEVVRFNTVESALLWVAGDLFFDGWVVDGNILDEGRLYQARFGTADGQRRAYFTERVRGTLCDLSVEDGFLRIRPTSLLPP